MFTDEELAAMGMPPRSQVERLLEHDPAGAARRAASFERAWSGTVDGYVAWIACTLEVVGRRHGAGALAAIVRATAALFGRHPAAWPADGMPSAADVEAATTAGRPEAALEAFDAMVDGWRDAHDLGRDWISAALSAVYRDLGVDELEVALRFAGEETLLRVMARDLERSAPDRLRGAVRAAHGHFTTLTVTEDDDAFHLEQDPCGSCSRQILDGRYDAPFDLAVVAEAHPVTGGRPGTPIYRTHVPVMHDALPRERFGFPWPVVRCPAGLGTGACHVTLPKHPERGA